MVEVIPTRAVKAVIRNDSGETLFLQRNPALRENDLWDLPGGLVEDEAMGAALRREVREELGVEVEVRAKVGRWSFFRPLDGRKVEVWNYACRLLGGDISLSDEHVAMRWVPKSELADISVKDRSLFDALG